MTTPKLKPCPFCGGDVLMGKTFDEMSCVYCAFCDYFHSEHDTPQAAAEAWNRRDDSPSTTDNRTEWGTCKICGLSRALKDGLCKHCVYEQEAPNE